MPQAITHKTSSAFLAEISLFGQRISRIGVDFAVCEGNGEVLFEAAGVRTDGLLQKSAEEKADLLRTVCREVSARRRRQNRFLVPPVHKLGFDRHILATAISIPGEPDRVAVAGPASPEIRPWLTELLRLFAKNLQTASQARQQIDLVSSELAQTYEELVLLHKLSINMKLTEPDMNFLQMACDSLTDIVDLEGIAVLTTSREQEDRRFTLAAGSGLIDIDDRMICNIHQRLISELRSGREALLDSEVGRPFNHSWQNNIRSIIAVPLWGKEPDRAESAAQGEGAPLIGIMVGFNRLDKPDFDSTDVKLFYSVANSCAVFSENGRLFADLKELLVGSLKALTSSIDAKDRYTLGHSERVGIISRWIAEKTAKAGLLDAAAVHKAYLAGLLHDIGKVSIDGSVLRKEGELTREELAHIKGHPAVGADILSEIKQMREIIPAVLGHHEQSDGRGYPNGWHADQVPILAKIVGLADSFDAMTSRRIYRDALSLDDALREIRNGLGKQFDRTVGTVFLESDVAELWDIVHKSFTGSHCRSRFAEYGSLAVAALLS